MSFVLILIAMALVQSCGLSSFPSSKTGPYFLAKDEPWRRKEEFHCLRSGDVHQSAFVISQSKINGPSFCGAERPFRVAAVASGLVTLSPYATLRCPMIPAVEWWVQQVVDPAALRYFGRPIVDIKVISSYSCRPQNNRRGARLSEHGYANALDVSSFKLAGGRIIAVKSGWRAGGAETAFLRHIHKRACDTFYTVLGPDHDRLHHNHFHLDLARHGPNGTKRVCK